MEVGAGTIDWQHLLRSVEESMHRVAHRNGVSVELLRQQYVLSTIMVTGPFPDYNFNPTNSSCYGRTNKYKGKRNSKPMEEFSYTYRTANNNDELHVQQGLIENPENANTKIYCDIEAALRGEISDNENQSDNDLDVASTPAGSEEHLDYRGLEEAEKTQESEILELATRYYSQQSLEVNALHKAFVLHLDENVMYVRIVGRQIPPIPDVSHLSIPSLEHCQMGTPVLVHANIKRNGENPGWYRAYIEGMDYEMSTVCVRLVDYGIPLRDLTPEELRVLPATSADAPAAYRIDISSIEEGVSLARNSFIAMRVVPMFGQSLNMNTRTWRATSVQPHTFSVHSVPSSDFMCDDAASDVTDNGVNSFDFSGMKRTVRTMEV